MSFFERFVKPDEKGYTYDMKIIVTHSSPDWDAITSAWLLKRFFPGWNEAGVKFVPAGQRLGGSTEAVIETLGKDEVIHVDTGMGPLDHHQTSDQNICGASRTWEFIKGTQGTEAMKDAKQEAIDRMVKIVVDIDHFKEVFWPEPTADYHEFSLLSVLEGVKLLRPNEDDYYVELGMTLLDSVQRAFENRIWAEHEIEENGKKFSTKWGKGIGFETINDDVLKLAQKMGYTVVVRKDPRKGYVRIKGKPGERVMSSELGVQSDKKGVDLTLVYEQLTKMDPDATWYLHVSKKMLLNGTPKNPKMIPSKLTLEQIIQVLEKI